jgi:hypothetical protein
LPDIFRQLNRSAIINACAAVYHRDKEYWLCIPTNGAPENNLVLVFHYEVREWTTRENYPVASILETADDSGALLFGSWDDTDHEGIFVYTRGAEDKDGVAIEPLWKSNPISIASSFRTFRPLHVLVNAIGHGNNPLTINLYSNHSLVPWLDPADSVPQQWPQEVLPVYGTAEYDDGSTWADWRPIDMRSDVTSTAHAPVFDCAIELAPASGTRFMTILSLDLEVSPEQTATKPLKADGRN